MGAGAIVFYLGNGVVSKMGGGNRKDLNPDEDAPAAGSGGAIVLGTILDGIPESLVLGIGLTVGGAVSVAFLAAVFISNLPEAIAATVSLKAAGTKHSSIMLMWVGIAALSALAAGIGYVVATSLGSRRHADPGVRGRGAAGDDHRHDGARGRRARRTEAGLATVLGFAVAAALSGLE